MPAIIRNGHIYGASPMFPIGAGDIDYNNTSSELESTNVQDAVDELKGIIDANPGTTYTLDTDGNNITLTPSEGSVQSITAPYATSAGNANTVNSHTVNADVPSNAVFTDTTYENATTSASGLMSASDKTKLNGLGTASTKDVATSGNASPTQVVMGNDTRLSDARPASDVSSWAKASTKPTYTASEVGAIATTAKGANNGVAELDSTGKVPSSQLPSFVDDVKEYDKLSDFPATGETDKIYIAKDTNKTYRWSGTTYIEISESLALGETSSTAYAGNKGKANADAIAAIKDGTNIDSFSDVESAISTLQSNFQDGVDDVYDAVVAKGSTPASKSLSDVVIGIGNIETKTIHTTTYTPTNRASNNDMGSEHTYRYVDTTSIPNSNSGTYDITSNGVKDMTATNTYRYANVNVPNSNSGTYDVTSNGIKDMGATNDKRYVNVNVPNSNSTTYTFPANDTGGTKDLGATNDYRYVNASNVYTKGKADGATVHTTTYTASSRGSALDMGSSHTYRYVNTNGVPNSNSGTYATVTTNGTHDMGATNSYRYVTVNVPHPTHSGTYTASSRSGALDMGATNTYRYVNTNSVPNSNSGTYGSVTSNGVKDMGATNSYRYCNINVPNSNSGTYTYASGSTGGTVDMGATNSYRYVNATNVYNKGKADGAGSISLISSNIQYIPNQAYGASGTPAPSDIWKTLYNGNESLYLAKTGNYKTLGGNYNGFGFYKLPIGKYKIITTYGYGYTNASFTDYNCFIYSGSGSVSNIQFKFSGGTVTSSGYTYYNGGFYISADINVTANDTIVAFKIGKSIRSGYISGDGVINTFACNVYSI